MTLMRIKPLCLYCLSYASPSHRCETRREFVAPNNRVSTRTIIDGPMTISTQSIRPPG